jgi:lysine 2,3-aminomutase
MKMWSSREISLNRAAELKSRIDGYLNIKETIQKGMSEEVQNNYRRSKKILLEYFNANEEDWNDYKWQLSNRISDAATLSLILNLSDREKKEIEEVGEKYRWAISPYYACLIGPDDKYDPIRLLSVPTYAEISSSSGESDPMGEKFTNPAGSITRRYPDRLIINTTNECAMYCRHCQRRRNIGESDCHRNDKDILESIEYVRNNPEVRDILLTGGDVLALSDSRLEWILKQLREIPHVEIIRLGTRTPVTVPQRITDELVDMLKKYHPIYLNTHFNHPKELTPEAKAACEKLANSGIPLGNQAVLLNGINNDKYVMRLLNHELLKVRVRPYYIFHSKHVEGTTHFNTSVDDGLEIMEYLRGYTSGLAIPNYIVNAPNGLGKTPLMPQYLVSRGPDFVMIRTWEGNVIKYENHPTKDIKDII